MSKMQMILKNFLRYEMKRETVLKMQIKPKNNLTIRKYIK